MCLFVYMCVYVCMYVCVVCVCVYVCVCVRVCVCVLDEELEDKKPLIVSGLKIILQESSLKVRELDIVVTYNSGGNGRGR